MTRQVLFLLVGLVVLVTGLARCSASRLSHRGPDVQVLARKSLGLGAVEQAATLVHGSGRVVVLTLEGEQAEALGLGRLLAEVQEAGKHHPGLTLEVLTVKAPAPLWTGDLPGFSARDFAAVTNGRAPPDAVISLAGLPRERLGADRPRLLVVADGAADPLPPLLNGSADLVIHPRLLENSAAGTNALQDWFLRWYEVLTPDEARAARRPDPS